MASNYQAIRAENKLDYGRKVTEYGRVLLANRYEDRTHFIFELLQNAEDALARRDTWNGPRSISFHLTKHCLSISHFGQPFSEGDVVGVCGIACSTKDLNSIGRFGIGFKSVYAYTNRPEIHSGIESFAIENYVSPIAIPPIDRPEDVTVILMPLNPAEKASHAEISTSLSRLGATALLFLRNIEEINWSVEGGNSGSYLRETLELAPDVHQITVIGLEQGKPEVDETWLVFSRPVFEAGRQTGHVELAFSLGFESATKRKHIEPIRHSRLVVFFPTVLETHLGFLVQGPYQTTPSRDNVPRSEPNQHLVNETAVCMTDAIRWIRDHDLLDPEMLQCLPLDPTKFNEANMFSPLFEATKKALRTEPLLPRFGGEYTPAATARLASSQEIRELFSPQRLSALYKEQHELYWLSGEITPDRTPELRNFLTRELGIAVVSPDAILTRLNQEFLEAQPDAWILELYQFLGGQAGLSRRFGDRFGDLPLVRLEDGTHVTPKQQGRPQVFLPTKVETGFPTVRASVCASDSALKFLQSLGLTEPDPVDDVILNLLPKYAKDSITLIDTEYEIDIRRILKAFATDSNSQRERLCADLREKQFVMVKDAGDGKKYWAAPAMAYLPTEKLLELFADVPGVYFVDDDYSCLRGEDIRKLLMSCGASRQLQLIPSDTTLSETELLEIRRQAGLERATSALPIKDKTIRGLNVLLKQMPQLQPLVRQKKATLLWEALSDFGSQNAHQPFSGEYRWNYSQASKSAFFDLAFIRELNQIAWIPNIEGQLQTVASLTFDSLGWTPNTLLQSKIRFKPLIIETLAQELGIETGVLDFLKSSGLTSLSELHKRLGILEANSNHDHQQTEPSSEGFEDSHNMPSELQTFAEDISIQASTRSSGAVSNSGNQNKNLTHPRPGSLQIPGQRQHSEQPESSRQNTNINNRQFVSYVAASLDDEASHSDGSNHPARMALEAQAIDHILAREPLWKRTATNNPGFDLFQNDETGSIHQWCEVKAMAGDLHSRPVGLSHTQFEHAQEYGDAYWLYVVEHAGSENARIVRIQNPAGKAQTFTFDHGWLQVAEIDQP